MTRPPSRIESSRVGPTGSGPGPPTPASSYCSKLLLEATARSYCSKLLLEATARSYCSKLLLEATARTDRVRHGHAVSDPVVAAGRRSQKPDSRHGTRRLPSRR